LTPALSPLRGEGARRATLEYRTSFPAFEEYGSVRCLTRRGLSNHQARPPRLPPPLKGERAGVRGEETRDLPCSRIEMPRPKQIQAASAKVACQSAGGL